MPLLNRRLTPEEINRLVSGGVLSPNTSLRAPTPAQEDVGLQSLSRETDIVAPGASMPLRNNMLGAPGADLANDPSVLASLTPSMDPNAAPPPRPVIAPPPVAPATPVIDIGDVDKPLGPYQPNAGLPNYQPSLNSGASAAPVRAVVGNSPAVPVAEQDPLSRTVSQQVAPAVQKAFSNNDPLIQNPLKSAAPPPEAPPTIDSGPAAQVTPGGASAEDLAHAARVRSTLQAQAKNNQAVANWKTGMQTAFDGYQQKPINDQIAFIDKQATQEKEVADQMYKASYMASAIAHGHKTRDDAITMKEIEAEEKKLNELETYNKTLLNEKIDPGRFFWKKSLPAKIGMIVGSLVAGVGGRNGGNPQLMLQLMDRDIREQIVDADNKRGGVDRQRGLYQDHMKILGNKQAARESSRIAMIDWLKDQVDLKAKEYAGPQAQMKAEAIKLDLEKAKADNYFKFHQFMNPDPRRPVGVGATKLDFKADHAVTLPDGRIFYANSTKEAEDLRGQTAAVGTLDGKISILERLSKEPKAYVDGRLKAAQQDLVITVKKAAGSGLNSEQDMVRVEHMAGVNGGALSYGAKQILGLNQGAKQAAELARTYYDNSVRASNGTVVQDGFIADPITGIPKRVAMPTGETTGNYGGASVAKKATPTPGAAPKK